MRDPPEAAAYLDRTYPDFNPWLYSFDAFVPILDFGTQKYWRANPNHVGDIPGFDAAAWVGIDAPSGAGPTITFGLMIDLVLIGVVLAIAKTRWVAVIGLVLVIGAPGGYVFVVTTLPAAIAWEGAPIGIILHQITVVQTVLGAILTALIITGFTGLLTREERLG